jgi:hypothetical protein
MSAAHVECQRLLSGQDAVNEVDDEAVADDPEVGEVVPEVVVDRHRIFQVENENVSENHKNCECLLIYNLLSFFSINIRYVDTTI